MTTTLTVCVLHPRLFDEDLFRGLTADCGRPIEIRCHDYQEGFELRTLKSDRGAEPDIVRASPALTDDLRQTLARAEIVQALDVPLHLPELAPCLRWVQAIGAGVWHLYPGELSEAGILLTNASGVAATTIAEFVFARLLELWKGLPDIRVAQQQRVWSPRQGRTLVGKTLGVVGVGAIGSEVVRLGQCFGMNVIGIRRNPAKSSTDPAQIWGGPDELHDLLRRADIVVVAVPENDETRHMFGVNEFSHMRSDAVICNVSRGSVIDETALIRALEAGEIGAAILDVTEQEPLDAGSPLWTVPNVYLSPHCAASSDGYPASVTELFAENTFHYLRGEPMRNLVDGTRGY
jgi:phosphoglycerate dehydrogenase-like enzyme